MVKNISISGSVPGKLGKFKAQEERRCGFSLSWNQVIELLLNHYKTSEPTKTES